MKETSQNLSTDKLAKLLKCIGRHRLERVGQGILKFAIENDAGVCRAFRLGTKSPRVVRVEEEESTDSGWRADLVVRGARGRTLTRIELKLGASLTSRQAQASIPWLVVPTNRAGQSRCPPAKVRNVIMWQDLARAADDTHLVRPLLECLDRICAEWWLESIGRAQVVAGLRSRSPDERVKPFLATLDILLAERLGKNYRPSPVWSAKRCPGGNRYVGYCLQYCDSPTLWLGFTAKKSGPDAWLWLGRYDDDSEIKSWPRKTWEAAEAADWIEATLQAEFDGCHKVQ